VQCSVALTGFADPDDTLIVKSPVALVAPVVVLGMLTVIWPAAAVAVIGPPTPAFVVAGDTATTNVPVPPVARICPSCVTPVGDAVHFAEILLGVSKIGAGAGAAVPNAFVAVGGVSSVRPAASVIANVRPVKHVPFVVIVNPPPLRCTGFPVIEMAVGKLVAIV
jgi:hypothetical protein